MPLPLRPVTTPIHNPWAFQENLKRVMAAKEKTRDIEPDPYAGVMLPGSKLTEQSIESY
jgi:hypothetical protein